MSLTGALCREGGGRVGRDGHGHTLPLPGCVGGTGKCLGKSGVVLGVHSRGAWKQEGKNYYYYYYEEMRGQGQNAARKFQLESRMRENSHWRAKGAAPRG